MLLDSLYVTEDDLDSLVAPQTLYHVLHKKTTWLFLYKMI